MEHQSIKQMFADPLTKRPTAQYDMGFLWEAYDFWITKGPKEMLRSCFNTERYIVAVKSDGN